jgi:hypothetical protein
MEDGRKNNGGGRKGAGRKKGIGLSFEIQKYCSYFIEDILKNDAIRLKATRQLSLKYDIEEEDYFYIIKNNGLYKLGYSSNWVKRYKQYKTHLGNVNLIFLTKQLDCFSIESSIHKMFNDSRINGEWFELTDDDLFCIINYCSEKIK